MAGAAGFELCGAGSLDLGVKLRFPFRTRNLKHEGRAGDISEGMWSKAVTPECGTARPGNAVSLSSHYQQKPD